MFATLQEIDPKYVKNLDEPTRIGTLGKHETISSIDQTIF